MQGAPPPGGGPLLHPPLPPGFLFPQGPPPPWLQQNISNLIQQLSLQNPQNISITWGTGPPPFMPGGIPGMPAMPAQQMLPPPPPAAAADGTASIQTQTGSPATGAPPAAAGVMMGPPFTVPLGPPVGGPPFPLPAGLPPAAFPPLPTTTPQTAGAQTQAVSQAGTAALVTTAATESGTSAATTTAGAQTGQPVGEQGAAAGREGRWVQFSQVRCVPCIALHWSCRVCPPGEVWSTGWTTLGPPMMMDDYMDPEAEAAIEEGGLDWDGLNSSWAGGFNSLQNVTLNALEGEKKSEATKERGEERCWLRGCVCMCVCGGG